ncbi:hypothetical protein OC842_000004 [Tilletia horrida]|uniref:Tr-type G domain-containing protein n=1 Tax=Tilletia horrida TaxID=155126 RepID=A0AAN6JUH7_9BASI|nr:hypothetical protein OC842_000004 [Tilletia horrida]
MSTSSPIPQSAASTAGAAAAAGPKATTLKATGHARPTIDALTNDAANATTASTNTASAAVGSGGATAPGAAGDNDARTLKSTLLLLLPQDSARSNTNDIKSEVSQEELLIEYVAEAIRIGAGEFVLRLGSAAQDGGAIKAAQHLQKKGSGGASGGKAASAGEQQQQQAGEAALIEYTEAEFDAAVKNLTEAARRVESVVTVLETRIWTVGGPDSSSGATADPGTVTPTAAPNADAAAITYKSGYIQVRRTPDSVASLIETRVAVIGNVDAGKSTLLGVLTKGGLDDGRGRARVHCFRHKHEVESGRTSSVSMEICGFDAQGEPVYNPSASGGGKHADEPVRKLSWEEICERSAKVVTFIDLAGHEKYLKSTVFGLTGCAPDFVLLMVGANAGLIGMSKEHLGIALALSVPVAVVVTKIDMCPPNILEQTIKQLTKILKSPGCRKTPVFITDKMSTVDAALRLGKGRDRICPIFLVSNVTGEGLGNLRSFMNVLPQSGVAKYSPKGAFEFQISDIFSVPFVGTVVSGVIVSGSVKVGDNLLIGPDSLGGFLPTTVRSIERKRVGVDAAYAGQSASFALKRIKRNMVRKGMVMLSRPSADGDPAPQAHMTCDAEVLCLYHSTTLSIGSCMVLHTQSIRQTVRIVGIAKLGPGGEVVAEQQDDGSGTGAAMAQMAVSSSSPSTAKGKGAAGALQQQPAQNHGAGGALAGANVPVVRTGDRALLRLQFIRFAEFIKVGHKLITREGKTKLIGVVRAVGNTGPLVPVGHKEIEGGR